MSAFAKFNFSDFCFWLCCKFAALGWRPRISRRTFPPPEEMHDAIRVVILKKVRGANPTDPVPYLALNHNTVPCTTLD